MTKLGGAPKFAVSSKMEVEIISVVGRLAHPTHPGGKRQRRILRHCLSVEDKSRNRMA